MSVAIHELTNAAHNSAPSRIRETIMICLANQLAADAHKKGRQLSSRPLFGPTEFVGAPDS
jgi:hypothetical protein